MRPKKVKKRVGQMTAAELEALTADLDEEFVVDKFGPPPPAALARWELAKRRLGRPVKGRGAKVIAVSVERGLLARSDRLARKLGVTRSALIARGLEAVLDHRHKEE